VAGPRSAPTSMGIRSGSTAFSGSRRTVPPLRSLADTGQYKNDDGAVRREARRAILTRASGS
jgi:hypothetical protein